VTRACWNINVVVSNGNIGDDLEVRASVKDGLVNPIREQDDRTCFVPKLLYKGLWRKGNVTLVIIHFKMVPEKGDDFVEYLSGDQDLWAHDILSLRVNQAVRTR
jgi:hypothetical protein